MQRPRLSSAMRDNWRHLQRLYGFDFDEQPKRTASLDSLINSSEGAVSSADASATDSDSGADTRDPEPKEVKKLLDRMTNKKYSQSYSSSSSGHMETIHEETTEPKVSVKEILARFENLTEKTDAPQVCVLFVVSEVF